MLFPLLSRVEEVQIDTRGWSIPKRCSLHCSTVGTHPPCLEWGGSGLSTGMVSPMPWFSILWVVCSPFLGMVPGKFRFLLIDVGPMTFSFLGHKSKKVRWLKHLRRMIQDSSCFLQSIAY